MAKRAPTILFASLGSVIGQSLLYGCFVTVFVVSLYVFSFVRPTSRLDRHYLHFVTSAMMFSLITARWTINVVRAFDGFVKSRNNPLAYWENLSEPLNLAQVSIYFFEVLLADAILTYRAFIIWNRKLWVLGFPAVCWLAAAASSIILVYNLSKPNTGLVDETEARYQHNINAWTVPAFVFSVSINIYCSSIIIARIWLVQRHLRPLINEKRSLWRSASMSMIVDSAAVYVAMSIGTMATQSDLSWVLMSFTGPVIGITFCLIILREGNTPPPTTHDRAGRDILS